MEVADRVPAEVWHRVFVTLDHRSLASCLKTCKMFAGVITDDFFWQELAQYRGLVDMLPSTEWRHAISSGTLKSPDGHVDVRSLRFDLGAITKSGVGYSSHDVHPLGPEITIDHLVDQYECGFLHGKHLKIESLPVGCIESRPDISACFATGIVYAARTVCIELKSLGIENWVMDLIRPTIRVTEWATQISVFPWEYNLLAQLTREKEDVNYPMLLPLEHFTRAKCVFKSWPSFIGSPWEKVEVEISEYPSEMRYLLISSGAMELSFPDCFNGPKFAQLGLRVVLPKEIKLHALDSMQDTVEVMEMLKRAVEEKLSMRHSQRSLFSRRLHPIEEFVEHYRCAE